MQLGWIDYSKDDHRRVLSVIDLLSEDGTLDELGIAPVRDGFSNLFFPGTSTIQTRAKYFLVVPYILDTLARQPDTSVDVILRKLDAMERQCGKILLDSNAEGVIGRNTLMSGGWVKRPPSEIYWSGIRQYGIFLRKGMSLSEYIKISSSLKRQKHDLKKLGNRNDDAAEFEHDDADAGALFSTAFWLLPPYSKDFKWTESLRMDLSVEEASFLKSQIIETQSNSILAYILENNLINVSAIDTFEDIYNSGIVDLLRDDMRQDYFFALAFSQFIYGAIVRYNVILSDGVNQKANNEWNQYIKNKNEYASLNLDIIFERLEIHNRNPQLLQFLNTVKQCLLNSDIDALDNCIKKREIQLKGPSRARLNRIGEFSSDVWIGGGRLDYRFKNAMTIIRDILNGLEE